MKLVYVAGPDVSKTQRRTILAREKGKLTPETFDDYRYLVSGKRYAPFIVGLPPSLPVTDIKRGKRLVREWWDRECEQRARGKAKGAPQWR